MHERTGFCMFSCIRAMKALSNTFALSVMACGKQTLSSDQSDIGSVVPSFSRSGICPVGYFDPVNYSAGMKFTDSPAPNVTGTKQPVWWPTDSGSR